MLADLTALDLIALGVSLALWAGFGALFQGRFRPARSINARMFRIREAWTDRGAERFVPLEQVVAANLDLLFPDVEVVAHSAFRVTRNAEVRRNEEVAEGLIETIEGVLRDRRFATVVRLELADDTPEAVVLSAFDPVRREVARLSLIKLVQDGRIHPTRIEEVVEKVRAEIEEELIETGERTVIDLNLHGLHPQLVRMVGRMRYRTSYGQNLLAHSMETARIASLIAAELDLDAARARRAGLLHDIGKVVDDEIESPHAIVGMELCRKYKEHRDVCNAVGAHHDETEMRCMIAPIVQAAEEATDYEDLQARLEQVRDKLDSNAFVRDLAIATFKARGSGDARGS